MVHVSCPSCGAPYQLEERRIPASGMKMRCPKCNTSFPVSKEGAATEGAAVKPVELDLPAAAPKKPPPPPPRPGLPKPAQKPIADPLDELPSLPAPKMPEPTKPPAAGLGEDDLPAFAPKRAPSLDMSDLPSVQGAGVPDLPLVQAAPRKPPPPPRKQSFGELDLPVVGGDIVDEPSLELPSLPTAATRPPVSQSSGFGEIDLPVVGEAALPAMSHAGLPQAASSAGLPARAEGPGLPAHSQGLGQLPAVGGSLPAPVLGGALPSPVKGGGLPARRDSSEFSFDEPPGVVGGLSTSQNTEGSIVARAKPGSIIGAELYEDTSGLSNDFHTQARKLPSDVPPPPEAAPERFEFGFGDDPADAPPPPPIDATGELDLGGAPPSRGRAPMGSMGSMSGGSLEEELPTERVGDEVDLGAAGLEEGPGFKGGGAVAQRREERPAAKPGRWKAIGIGLGLAVLGGGAALALVPEVGPFGVYFISDYLSRGANESALAALRKSSQVALDPDTASGASRALGAARAAHAAKPRHRESAAYAAYVAFVTGIRFGKKAADDTFGKQALAAAQGKPSDELALATAASEVANGQFSRARGVVSELAKKHPRDVDVAVLLGEIDLASKETQKSAVESWTSAVAIQRSARTLFGLARAQRLSGDKKAAEATAREVLAASASHAGARTLLASLLVGGDEKRENEAVQLLTKLGEEGEVRQAASDVELVEGLTQLGRLHLARSRVTAAERAFQTSLQINPQALPARIGLGDLYYQSGRYSEALTNFDQAVKAEPENPVARLGVARAYLQLERAKDALDILRKLAEQKKDDVAALYWLARAEAAVGNKKGAEEAYSKAIATGQTTTEVVDSYVSLAFLLSAQGRNDDATAKLAEADQKFPGLPALHKAKGEVYLGQGRYEEARAELQAALGIQEDLGTRFRLGVTLRRMRAFDEAAKAFDEVAAGDKDFPGLALERGLLFEETGQSDKAVEMYSSALAKAPTDVDLKLRVASAQVMAGRGEQAEKALREILRERNSAEANHYLGRAMMLQGPTKLGDALRHLERAVELDGNRAEYHLYVGWAANDGGQPQKAETALKKAIELDQGNGDAWWQKGSLLRKQGATIDAIASLEKAIERRPSRYEAYADLALCFQEQAKWPEAEAALRKAIAGNPKNPRWHFMLGKVLDKMGNKAGTVEPLEKAVALLTTDEQRKQYFEAYFLLGEAYGSAQRDKAVAAFQKFLELAPDGNAYRVDAQRALAGLGAPQR